MPLPMLFPYHPSFLLWLGAAIIGFGFAKKSIVCLSFRNEFPFLQHWREEVGLNDLLVCQSKKMQSQTVAN